MPDSKDRPSGQTPPDVNRKGDSGDIPRLVPARQTLDQTKRPREWRTTRAGEHGAAGEGSSQPGPRIAKHVPAASAAAPAGSHAPVDLAPTSPSAARAEAPTPAIDAPPDVPLRHGVDRLVVLVRDPYWVYAWWELTESRLNAGLREIGADSQLVLRVYDISLIDWNGQNHHDHFDLEIEDLAGNWYIELGRPGASFCAELGLRRADGRFLALVRSNMVTLPRDSMSPVVDEEWMVVEEDYRTLFDLSGGGSIGLGSGEIQRMLEQRLKSELASGGVSSFGISSATGRRKPS